MCALPLSVRRATSAACVVLMAGMLAPDAGVAANHPYSSVLPICEVLPNCKVLPNGEVLPNVEVLNLTANVDWDYDLDAPVQAGGTTRLTRELVEKELLREMARSIYLMTEGRHRVGTVYLFKNARFGNEVDIRILNTEGHSNASLGGWKQEGQTSNNFLTFQGRPESTFNFARVISHELGHYVYGLFDEYADSTRPASEYFGHPVARDTPRATIMHDHERFLRLSVAEDYKSGVTTAQSRGYGLDASGKGASHWETLVRDPRQDPAQVQPSTRTQFKAFKGMQAPTSLEQLSFFPGVVCDAANACEDGANGTQGVPAPYRLSSAQELQAHLWALSGGSLTADAVDGAPGAFQNFRVVFVDSPDAPVAPQATRMARNAASVGEVLNASRSAMAQTSASSRHVIVLDRSLPESAWRSAVATAQGQLELYEDEEQVAVLVEPPAPSLPPFQMMTASEARVLWGQALNQVGGAASGSLDVAAIYAKALPLLQSGRKLGAPASIELLTAPASPGRSGPKVAENLAETVRAQAVAVNVTRLRLAGTTGLSSSLEQLAKGTGGNFNAARDENDALQNIARNMQLATGLVVASAGMDSYPPAAAASTERLPFVLGEKFDTAAAVRWFHSPQDAGKLQFRVYNDAGQSYTQLSEDSAPQEGFSIIELPEQALSQGGQWYAEVRRTGATVHDVDVEALVESSLTLVPSSLGGELAQPQQPPALRAKLSTTLPLVGAQVMADIFRADDGTLALSDVVLRDDGRSLDLRANDGLYGVDLSGKLPAGDYVAMIRAETVDGSALEPTQIFVNTRASTDTTSRIPVAPGLVRMDTESFTLEAGAPGVLPNPSRDSGGGGCTSVEGQRDGGLLALLLMALAGLGLRRRAQRAPAAPR